MSIISLVEKIQRRVISFFISFFVSKDNKNDFNSVYKDAVALFEGRLASYEYQKYVLPQWQENTAKIESFFKKGFSFSFLRNTVLRSTMFFQPLKTATDLQKNLLKKMYDINYLKSILKEHSTGAPLLSDFEFTSSGNTIHHFYHLAKFEEETGVTIKNLDYIIEFGGGYGNLAKIVRKITPTATYVIIDIPVFSYIQLVYLKTLFGNDAVQLFDAHKGIVAGKINIMPFDESSLKNLSTAFVKKPDLFISTWALSESNDATQSLIESLNYFNASHLLVAYQKTNPQFQYAENIVNRIKEYTSIYNQETEYLKDNYYLFATALK